MQMGTEWNRGGIGERLRGVGWPQSAGFHRSRPLEGINRCGLTSSTGGGQGVGRRACFFVCVQRGGGHGGDDGDGGLRGMCRPGARHVDPRPRNGAGDAANRRLGFRELAMTRSWQQKLAWRSHRKLISANQ